MTTLLIASTGGHLKELHHLHRRLAGIDGPYRWLTFDTAQSRSLLQGEEVEFIRFVGDRDARNALASLPEAARFVGRPDVRAVISTGASVAVPYSLAARGRGRRCLYVESAARLAGPSLTGRMLKRIPGVELYNQCSGWSGGRWRFGGSVFDSFEELATPPRRTEMPIRRVVVALGTTAEGFPRVIRRLKQILPAEAEVIWQTGNTDVSGLDLPGRAMIPERELTEAMREADVVVSHAGVGNALAALEAGKFPILVPRRLAHGELVDDHQIQVARELSARGLSLSVEADELTYGDLLIAAGRKVGIAGSVPPFAGSAA